MPYPSKIDKETIIRTTGEWIERDGAAALSLNQLAASFGIKTPSLYRYVGGRDDLLREVNLRTIEELIGLMEEAISAESQTPAQHLIDTMHAYRAFIHANPNRYRLIFTGNDAHRPDDDLLVKLVLPIQSVVSQVVGEAPSLTVLRGAMALVHGFGLLEINQVLRRGGDLSADFDVTLKAFVAGSIQAGTTT